MLNGGGFMMMKPRRFFYHYNKNSKMMTVHFKGTYIQTKEVHCNVPCQTKWNNRQPFLVMRGWADNVEVLGGLVIIS